MLKLSSQNVNHAGNYTLEQRARSKEIDNSNSVIEVPTLTFTISMHTDNTAPYFLKSIPYLSVRVKSKLEYILPNIKDSEEDKYFLAFELENKGHTDFIEMNAES